MLLASDRMGGQLRVVVDAFELFPVSRNEIGESELRITDQSGFYLRAGCRIGEISSRVLRSDRVGFAFLQVLALVVAAHRHRNAEADEQGQ